MSKSIILADLHIGFSSNNTIYDLQKKTLKNILDKCVNNNINRVIILGDIFHVTHPPIEYYNFLLKIIKEYPFEFVFMIGNHDYYSSKYNSLNIIQLLSEFISDKIKVIDKQEIYKDITYIPFPYSITKTKTKFTFVHTSVQGAKLDNDMVERNVKKYTLKKEFITSCDTYFISGHFHSFQDVYDNFSYVGSPYQINFGDKQKKKRFGIIAKNELKWIEYTPNYILHKLVLNKESDIDWSLLNNEFSNNFFSIEYNRDLKRDTIQRLTTFSNIIKLNPINEELNFEFKEIKTEELPSIVSMLFSNVESLLKDNGISDKNISIIFKEIQEIVMSKNFGG